MNTFGYLLELLSAEAVPIVCNMQSGVLFLEERENIAARELAVGKGRAG